MRPSTIVKLTAGVLLALSLSAAGEAPASGAGAAPTPERQCFWSRQVQNFAYAPPDKVNLRVGVRDVYELTLFGECSDIDHANAISFDTHGFSMVCNGVDIDLIVPTTLGPRRCQVRSLRHLTADEVAALPSRARP